MVDHLSDVDKTILRTLAGYSDEHGTALSWADLHKIVADCLGDARRQSVATISLYVGLGLLSQQTDEIYRIEPKLLADVRRLGLEPIPFSTLPGASTATFRAVAEEMVTASEAKQRQEADARRRELRQSLEQLDVRVLDVLVDDAGEFVTYADIADETGCTESGLGKRIQKLARHVGSVYDIDNRPASGHARLRIL